MLVVCTVVMLDWPDWPQLSLPVACQLGRPAAWQVVVALLVTSCSPMIPGCPFCLVLAVMISQGHFGDANSFGPIGPKPCTELVLVAPYSAIPPSK